MNLRDHLKKANWQLIIAAPIAAGILHICATLAAPYLTAASAFTRLAPALPVNKMLVLHDIAPGAEPLPFLSPHARYAMCLFDSTKGPVSVSATLPPDPGWMLAVITPQGDNVYAAASSPGRETPITLVLVPSESHFLGVTPEARGIARDQQPPAAIAAKHGIVVLRGPDRGLAYHSEVEKSLKQAACSGRPVLTPSALRAKRVAKPVQLLGQLEHVALPLRLWLLAADCSGDCAARARPSARSEHRETR